jgi:hypothetical protein
MFLKSPGCESGSGLFLARDPDLAPDPGRHRCFSGKNQEQDQDHEQELKLSTFAGDESC